MIQYLHLDVIPIIFSYLSQYELLNILLTNRFIYSQIMKYINTTKFILIDNNNNLEYGCNNNLIISIKQVKYKLDWNLGLYSACKGGNECIGIVKLMIEKGANNWNLGLYGACNGGNESIVKLIIEKGANKWNKGLYNACKGGHESIVKLMIEKGANHLNLGLYQACFGGHKSIVKLMIEKGAKGANRCYCNKLIKEHIK